MYILVPIPTMCIYQRCNQQGNDTTMCLYQQCPALIPAIPGIDSIEGDGRQGTNQIGILSGGESSFRFYKFYF